MDYTTHYALGMPEEGAENSGTAYNGNMELIDAMLMQRENLVLSDDVFLKSGDDMIYHSI